MGTTHDSPTTDGNKAHREADAETRKFIEQHNVTKLAPKAVPGAGEEAADLLQDVKDGRLPN